MALIGGVARAFDLNMVPEAVSKKLEPMLYTCVYGNEYLLNVVEIANEFKGSLNIGSKA